MKRIVSLTVAVILVFAMLPMTLFAAEGDYTLGLSGSLPDPVRPNTWIRLNIFNNGKAITKTEVNSEKLDVKVASSTGSKLIDKVSIAYDSNGAAYVKMEFVELFVSTKEQDFDVDVYLTKNKSRISGSEITVSGSMENEYQTVTNRDEYVNAQDSPVIEADDNISKIEVDLGYGISIIARMTSGKRYYAYATTEPTSEDDKMMDKYRDIDSVFNLTTINMSGSANKVRFDLDDKYYVYNSGMQLVGTTKEDLPYSTKYYVSLKELNVDSSDQSSSSSSGPSSDDDLLNDNGPTANNNNNNGLLGNNGINPNTGVTGHKTAAIVTAIASLALAGAILIKRPNRKK